MNKNRSLLHGPVFDAAKCKLYGSGPGLAYHLLLLLDGQWPGGTRPRIGFASSRKLPTPASTPSSAGRPAGPLRRRFFEKGGELPRRAVLVLAAAAAAAAAAPITSSAADAEEAEQKALRMDRATDDKNGMPRVGSTASRKRVDRPLLEWANGRFDRSIVRSFDRSIVRSFVRSFEVAATIDLRVVGPLSLARDAAAPQYAMHRHQRPRQYRNAR
jgi:Ni/Co efflux regulator RcnB